MAGIAAGKLAISGVAKRSVASSGRCAEIVQFSAVPVLLMAKLIAMHCEPFSLEEQV